jgi:hypothetical protein
LEKIIILSDAHLYRNACEKKKEEERKEGKLPILEMLYMKVFKAFFEKWEGLAGEYFREMINKIYELKLGPFSYFLGLGDTTDGSYNQGLITDEARQERLAYNQLINNSFSDNGLEKKFLWGNHDTGFQDKLTKIFNLGYWSKGMSKESFQEAERLIGPAWDTFEVEGFIFLLLNSEIIRSSVLIESIDPSERCFFMERKREQEDFVRRVLEENQNQGKKKIILAIHDSSQLKHIWFLLEPYHQEICLTLAGHFHLSSSERFFQRFYSIYRKVNLRIITSLWPFGGDFIGRIIKEPGGFAVLELSDSSFNLKTYWL